MGAISGVAAAVRGAKGSVDNNSFRAISVAATFENNYGGASAIIGGSWPVGGVLDWRRNGIGASQWHIIGACDNRIGHILDRYILGTSLGELGVKNWGRKGVITRRTEDISDAISRSVEVSILIVLDVISPLDGEAVLAEVTGFSIVGPAPEVSTRQGGDLGKDMIDVRREVTFGIRCTAAIYHGVGEIIGALGEESAAGLGDFCGL